MLPQNYPAKDTVDSKTYPLVEQTEQTQHPNVLALVALTHTAVEQRLYAAMLAVLKDELRPKTFTARHLSLMTGIRSLSTVRRGLEGLLLKRSIEKLGWQEGNGKREHSHVYRVYLPNEVVARRNALDGPSFCAFSHMANGKHLSSKAISRVSENLMLSRREVQVALCCAEGLTNAAIGKRLNVSEQTVKFHMRNVFI